MGCEESRKVPRGAAEADVVHHMSHSAICTVQSRGTSSCPLPASRPMSAVIRRRSAKVHLHTRDGVATFQTRPADVAGAPGKVKWTNVESRDARRNPSSRRPSNRLRAYSLTRPHLRRNLWQGRVRERSTAGGGTAGALPDWRAYSLPLPGRPKSQKSLHADTNKNGGLARP